jgi:hypothetical protein
MTDAEIAELLVRRYGRHGTVEVLCGKAHAEIMRLRALVREAYFEGHRDGVRWGSQSTLEDWDRSESSVALIAHE